MSKTETLLLGCILYLTIVTVYRLWFSPVAHIPGPLLARATYWYEFYFDVILKGRYTFKIRELHDVYGPIVRINPHEVHINDPDFFDEVYANSSKKRERWSWFYKAFGLPDVSLTTIGHDEHRMRRAPLNPYFSKAKVRSLQSRIEVVVSNWIERLEEHKKSGDPLRIDFACSALSNDIAMDYAFGRSYNRIAKKDFDPEFFNSSHAATKSLHLLKHLPFILSMMRTIPESYWRSRNPDMAGSFRIRDDLMKQVAETQAELKTTTKKSASTTIFHELIQNEDPSAPRSFSYLWQNGFVVVLGATTTTATTMYITLFHLLQRPQCLKRLRQELASIFDRDGEPSLAALENLPYLTAVVKEGLRMSWTVTTRLARIDPNDPIVFEDRFKTNGKVYTIPRGTPVSMTVFLIHTDHKIYPEPMTFRPERWLKEGGNNPPLDKHFVPFTKGARQCIGINLAYAELYIVLAQLFKPGAYGSKDTVEHGDLGCIELYETTERDVELVGDALGPLYRDDSNGVRILIKPVGHENI